MCIRTTFSDFGRADAANLLSRESGFLRVKKSSGKKNLKKRAKSIRTSRDCFRYWLRFFLLFFSFLIPFVRFVWKTVSRPISCRKRTRGKQMRRDIIIIIPFFFFFVPVSVSKGVVRRRLKDCRARRAAHEFIFHVHCRGTARSPLSFFAPEHSEWFTRARNTRRLGFEVVYLRGCTFII